MFVTRTPFLVIVVILLAIGITSAYSLTLTFAGDVLVTGNLDSVGAITSPTITSLQSQITSIDGRVTTLEGP